MLAIYCSLGIEVAVVNCIQSQTLGEEPTLVVGARKLVVVMSELGVEGNILVVAVSMLGEVVSELGVVVI